MKDSGRLALLRAEGLAEDFSALGCYVTVDGRLYDIITPLHFASSDSVAIPEDGLLRLVVRCMAREDRVISGVTLPISLLPEGSPQWLPLSGSDSAVLTELRRDVEAPRLLVCRSSAAKADHSKTSERRTHSLEPGLRLKPIEPPISLQKDTQNTYILERQKMRIQKQNSVIEDLTQQVSDLRGYLAKQTDQEATWRKLFADLRTAAEGSAKSSRQREETLAAALRAVEARCKALSEENMRLKLELISKESESYQLLETNSFLKAQVLVEGTGGLDCAALKQRIAELEARLAAHDESSFLDRALQEFFQRSPPVAKVSPGVYVMKGEQFALSFLSGMLVVKARGGHLLFSEFLRLRQVPFPHDDRMVVEFPACAAVPSIRSVPSPIRSKPEASSSQEDSDSTFQTDISNLIQELEFDTRRVETSPGPKSDRRARGSQRPALRFDPRRKAK